MIIIIDRSCNSVLFKAQHTTVKEIIFFETLNDHLIQSLYFTD